METNDTEVINHTQEGDKTLKCEDIVSSSPAINGVVNGGGGGGSDSGVEAGGQIDGYDSLIGGTVSTSCESSLLSYSGDLENVISSELPPRSTSSASSSNGGRKTTTPLNSRRSPTVQNKTTIASTARSTRRTDRQQKSTALVSKTGTSSTSTTLKATNRRTEARSASRGRTPPTTDDGRWPSVSIKPVRRLNPSTSTNTPTTSIEKRSPKLPPTNMTPEEAHSTFDKYATLPRRRNRVTVKIQTNTPTITETSPRESSLNRTASLRRQRLVGTNNSTSSSGYKSDAEDTINSSIRSKSLTRSLPPYPKRRKNMKDGSAQTERILHSPEELQYQLERLDLENSKNLLSLEVTKKQLEKERSQREILQAEATRVATRVTTLIHGEGAAPQPDWLLDLETKFCATQEIAARNHKELIKVQKQNRLLLEELEKNTSTVKTVQQQLNDAEEEAIELQDFLSAEKSTLAESLREAEDKVTSLKKELEEKEKDIERHKDECRHLVRLNEKRKQETEELKTKVASTERLLVLQGGCTTAASVALAGLCSRLESLLPQLNSPKDDIDIFLNEAYHSSSSVEASPEHKRKTPTNASKLLPEVEEQDEEILSQVRSPLDMYKEDTDDDMTTNNLRGSPSLNDLTQAIISCHNCQDQASEQQPNVSLTDQATELDKLVSKLLETFQKLIQQREQSLHELNVFKKKYESEHSALLEANTQFEEQNLRMKKLETAQRIAQQTDESQTLRDRLNEKDKQLLEMNNKIASNKQLLINNWRQAVDGLRKQYDVIDKALDIFHKEQALIDQSTGLKQLQHELEETNFHCVTLPAPIPLEENGTSPNKTSTTNGVVDILQNLHLLEAVNGTA